MAQGDPEQLLSLPARITCAILSHCGDIVRVALSDDPELKAAAIEGHRRHRAGIEAMIGRFAGVAPLPPAADIQLLGYTVAAITDLRVAISLLDEFGWDFPRVEAWMTAMVTRTLLPAEGTFALPNLESPVPNT